MSQIVETITGRPVQDPHRVSKTHIQAINGLWRHDGRRPFAEFAGDLLLVAQAAHDCPWKLFARDIRAEGWPEGTDRQRSVPTVCRQGRWDERLEAAQRWAAAGYPTHLETANGTRGDWSSVGQGYDADDVIDF